MRREKGQTAFTKIHCGPDAKPVSRYCWEPGLALATTQLGWALSLEEAVQTLPLQLWRDVVFVLTLAWFPLCSGCHLHLRQVAGDHQCGRAAAACVLSSEDAQSV